MDYYNEFDEYPLQWLRNLSAAGHIPDGTFDGRSIVDVKAEDVRTATKAHFFAGIGGWPLALKLAGWPEDQEVWTGSCPCQPFSVAGGRRGTKDKRHLWPDFFRLIKECLPPVVFGEQVASKDGRTWLSGVRADLESLGYEVGAADLCAAGAGEEGEGWILRGDRVFVEPTLIGAPHLRQRLFWVAKSSSFRYRPFDVESESRRGERAVRQDGLEVAGRMADAGASGRGALQRTGGADGRAEVEPTGHGDLGRLADRERERLERLQEQSSREELAATERSGLSGRVANGNGEGRRLIRAGDDEAGNIPSGGDADGRGKTRPVANSACPGAGDDESERKRRATSELISHGEASPLDNADRDGEVGTGPEEQEPDAGRTFGPWGRFDVLPCSDKRARRVESGTFPLAHGVPGRVGKLRAYGNAIVSELAKEFILAFLESLPR